MKRALERYGRTVLARACPPHALALLWRVAIQTFSHAGMSLHQSQSCRLLSQRKAVTHHVTAQGPTLCRMHCSPYTSIPFPTRGWLRSIWALQPWGRRAATLNQSWRLSSMVERLVFLRAGCGSIPQVAYQTAWRGALSGVCRRPSNL